MRNIEELNDLVIQLLRKVELLEKAVENNRKLGAINEGDSAWMLSATGLVILMTIPGLALYYSGMVRIYNVLSTVMQSFTITCVITMLWLAVGYSLAFAPADELQHSSSVIGNTSRMWLIGINSNTIHALAPTIPEFGFCVFELAFAIITPALICGAFAYRMKYFAMVLLYPFGIL